MGAAASGATQQTGSNSQNGGCSDGRTNEAVTISVLPSNLQVFRFRVELYNLGIIQMGYVLIEFAKLSNLLDS
jgi:hypothetical protein